MNKTIKIIIGVFAAVVIIAGAYWGYVTFIQKNDTVTSSKEVYVCPMHPQIVQDRPGQCPICGMDLVKEDEVDQEDHSDHDLGGTDISTVKLSPSQQVLANVQTERVKTMQFQGEKTFNGYVKINESKFAHISTAVSGKIVKMFISFEGEMVRKGQKSP